MIKTRISVLDMAVGMRVAMDSHYPPGGWVYHSDHRVVSIHHYNSGEIMCFVLEPWRGGESQIVQARDVITVYALTRRQQPMRSRE